MIDISNDMAICLYSSIQRHVVIIFEVKQHAGLEARLIDRLHNRPKQQNNNGGRTMRLNP